MVAHRIITSIGAQSSIQISNLPFKVGQKVEVIIMPDESEDTQTTKKISSVSGSLQGTLRKYIDPFGSVTDHQ